MVPGGSFMVDCSPVGLSAVINNRRRRQAVLFFIPFSAAFWLGNNLQGCVGEDEELPVIRGMKSGPDGLGHEQNRNSRSWQVRREGQEEAKPAGRKNS